jgi:putative ABC transport system permease protein
VPYTIVGIAPRGFEFPLDLPGVKLWTTISDEATGPEQRGSRMLDVVGRLQPGISIRQAQDQMDVVAAGLAREYPEPNRHVATTLVEPEQTRLRAGGGAILFVLFGGVVLVLLIACANVASLLLARSAERGREFALRMALGASRAAIVRQLLIESLALGFLGTAGGVVAAVGLLRLMLPLAGDHIPRLAETTVDWRVLAFSIALAILTSVLFGVAPALQARRTDPAGELKEGARTIAAGRDRFHSVLVAGQIALGVVLLVGATLLLSAFVDQVRRDPGFKVDRLLTFEVGVSGPQYPEDAQIAFSDRLREGLRAIPGVTSAAAGTPLPLQGHQMRVGFDIEGRSIPRAERPRSDVAIVTPAYFETLGIAMLKGRDFTEADRAGTSLVVIVNEAFARRYFPGQDAVGKRILPGVGKAPVPPREIVGIVGNARQVPLASDPDPIYYLPYKQLPWFIGTVLVRSALSPNDVEAGARTVLSQLDRGVPMQRVLTGAQLASEVLAPARFVTVLMSSFAVVALLLTVAGLYGVLSYMVTKRRREIGVRIALGAPRTETIGLVWRCAARLVAAGLFVGTGAAIGLARVAASVIGGGPVGLPSVLAATWCAMAITSALAALVPAARAASIDPMQALRTE